jgi:hypothetical protein
MRAIVIGFVVATSSCGSRTGLYPDEDGSAVEDASLLDHVDEWGFRDDASDGGMDSAPDVIPVGCNPVLCKGCCNGDECLIGEQQKNFCGANGDACEVCAKGDTCKNGTCFHQQANCGPMNCTGCCLFQGTACATGTHSFACGHGGEPCSLCLPSEGNQCMPLNNGGGTCSNIAPCAPSNCMGCCYGQVCATGTQDFACGSSGLTCEDCVGQERHCKAGTCQK